jgi:hypothetical protein
MDKNNCTKVIGYKLLRPNKGFDTFYDLYGSTYEVGKTYELNSDVNCRESGYDFCEMPLDVMDLHYQDDINVVYGLIEAYHSNDSDNIYSFSKPMVRYNADCPSYMSQSNNMRIIRLITKDELLDGYEDGEHITFSGDIFWLKNKKLHRDDDLPALIRVNGDQVWFQNGLIHRDANKPAKKTCIMYYWFNHGIMTHYMRPFPDFDILEEIYLRAVKALSEYNQTQDVSYKYFKQKILKPYYNEIKQKQSEHIIGDIDPRTAMDMDERHFGKLRGPLALSPRFFNDKFGYIDIDDKIVMDRRIYTIIHRDLLTLILG